MDYFHHSPHRLPLNFDHRVIYLEYTNIDNKLIHGSKSLPSLSDVFIRYSCSMYTGLDNLPNEVQHLLQEIKLKEQRCQGKFYPSYKYQGVVGTPM